MNNTQYPKLTKGMVVRHRKTNTFGRIAQVRKSYILVDYEGLVEFMSVTFRADRSGFYKMFRTSAEFDSVDRAECREWLSRVRADLPASYVPRRAKVTLSEVGRGSQTKQLSLFGDKEAT